MGIKEIINKLVVIEDLISFSYNNLYKIEMANEKDGCLYSHYINSLKDVLKEEEMFFDSLSINDTRELFIYIKTKRDQLIKRFTPNEFRTLIIDRIYRTIENSMVNKSLNDIGNSDEYDIDRLIRLKEDKKVTNIVYEERDDIYLSFLDEYISKCDDIRVKNKLIHSKYSYVFVGNKSFEKKVVDRDYNTERSLYVDSEITAMLTNVDLDRFYSIKKEVGSSLVVGCIEELILKNNFSSNYKNNLNYLDEAWNISMFLQIRTYCLLMDDDTFNSFMNFFTKTEDVFSRINSLFDIDIIELLKKDRERHKYLSLKIK